MNGVSLTALVHQIGALKVTGFFLVLARVTPLFVLAPLFSSAMVPARVRGIVAVALSIGMTPIAVRGVTLPTDPLAVTGLLVEQIIVGIAFAFAIGAVYAAIEAAGSVIDLIAGYSFGSFIDPIDNRPGGPMTSIYGLVGLAVFVAIGGDAWMLRGLARTFDLVPLGHSAPIASLTTGVEMAFASIFVSALEVAAPVLLALLVTDVAFGMVSRIVPQVNVFGVGFPMKLGVSMLVVAASLPFLAGFESTAISNAVTTALNTI